MWSNGKPALGREQVFANSRCQPGQTYSHGDYTAVIAPCVWSYPGYPLQVAVDSPHGQTGLVDRGLNATTAVVGDIFRLLEGIRTIPCKNGCGGVAFDPSTVDTNRDGHCESCFMAKLDAQFAKDDAREKKAERRRDLRQKARGMTHKVTAWVHAGGDDQQVIIYINQEPTDAYIKGVLKRHRSRILDDYTIEKI